MKKFFKIVIWPFKWLFKRIVRFGIWLYCKVIFRAKIVGKRNIPRKGALVVCGNHESFLDPAIITATMPRDIRFLVKKELWRFKFLAFMGKVFEEIPVSRDERDIATVKIVLKALKNDECIGIFPEGTRKGMEKGADVKNGAAFFALRSGAKVLPAWISKIEKKNRFMFKRVTLKYGEPLDFSSYGKDDVEKVTEEIMSAILKLEE